MTDMTSSPSRRERPQAPVRPSRPVSTVRATGTAENTVQPVRTAPVAPERQFSTRREMRLAQRASQTPMEPVERPTRRPLPQKKNENASPVAPKREPVVVEPEVLVVTEIREPVVFEPEEPVETEVQETVAVPDEFWQDLNDDLEDPEYHRSYEEASEEVNEFDDDEAERQRLREENATRVTGFAPVVFSEEELSLMRSGRDFVRLVWNDDVVGEILVESELDTKKLDDRLRVLLRSR